MPLTYFEKSLKRDGTTKAAFFERLSRKNVEAWLEKVGDEGIEPRELARLMPRWAKTRKWRQDVLARDDFKCRDCGDGSRLVAGPTDWLEVHHITPVLSIILLHGIKTRREAYEHPKLWAVENGLTLCLDCHKKKHNILEQIREGLK